MSENDKETEPKDDVCFRRGKWDTLTNEMAWFLHAFELHHKPSVRLATLAYILTHVHSTPQSIREIRSISLDRAYNDVSELRNALEEFKRLLPGYWGEIEQPQPSYTFALHYTSKRNPKVLKAYIEDHPDKFDKISQLTGLPFRYRIDVAASTQSEPPPLKGQEEAPASPTQEGAGPANHQHNSDSERPSPSVIVISNREETSTTVNMASLAAGASVSTEMHSSDLEYHADTKGSRVLPLALISVLAVTCLLTAVVALLFFQTFRPAGPGMEEDEFRAVLSLLHQPSMNQENPSLLSARLGLPPQDPELSLIAKRHTKDPEVQALIMQTFIAGREKKINELRKNAETLRDLLPKWGIPSVILGYLSLPENTEATPGSKKIAVAESFIHEAKQKFKDARDIRGEIFSLIVEAELHRLDGQQNTAIQALDEAAESADSAGFAEIRSYVHLLKASLLKQTGQYEQALSELNIAEKNAYGASKAYILTDACNERGWIALCQDLGKVDKKNAIESSQGIALRAYKIFVEAEKLARDAGYIEGLQSALIGQWKCLHQEYLVRIADARQPQPEALKAEINKLQSLRANLCSEMLDLINKQDTPGTAIKSIISKDLAGCTTIAEQFSLYQQHERAIAVAKEAAEIAEKMNIECQPDPKTVLHQVQERAAKTTAPAIP